MTRTRSRRGTGPPPTPAPTREAMIREAAYYLFLSGDRAPGRDLDHWLAAEALIDDRLAGEALTRQAEAVLRASRAKPDRARRGRGAGGG